MIKRMTGFSCGSSFPGGSRFGMTSLTRQKRVYWVSVLQKIIHNSNPFNYQSFAIITGIARFYLHIATELLFRVSSGGWWSKRSRLSLIWRKPFALMFEASQRDIDKKFALFYRCIMELKRIIFCFFQTIGSRDWLFRSQGRGMIFYGRLIWLDHFSLMLVFFAWR